MFQRNWFYARASMNKSRLGRKKRGNIVPRIGLIAGSGRFPLYFAEAAKMSGNEVIAIAIREEASPEIEKLVSEVHWYHIGELQNVIDTFKKADVHRMVMAGKVTKALIFENIHPDKRLMGLLKKVPTMTDTAL